MNSLLNLLELADIVGRVAGVAMSPCRWVAGSRIYRVTGSQGRGVAGLAVLTVSPGRGVAGLAVRRVAGSPGGGSVVRQVGRLGRHGLALADPERAAFAPIIHQTDSSLIVKQIKLSIQYSIDNLRTLSPHAGIPATEDKLANIRSTSPW